MQRLQQEIDEIRVRADAQKRQDHAKFLEMQKRLQEKTNQAHEAETAAHSSDHVLVALQRQCTPQKDAHKLLQDQIAAQTIQLADLSAQLIASRQELATAAH